MTLYASKATPPPPRHRAAPVKPSPPLSLLAALLVVAGIWADGWAGILLSSSGVACAGTFLVLHLRHAAWTVREGVRQELSQ